MRKTIIVFITFLLLPFSSWAATTVTIDGSTTYQTITGTETTILGMPNAYSAFSGALPTIGDDLLNTFGANIIKIRIPNMDTFEPANDNSNPLSFNWNYYATQFANTDPTNFFETVQDWYQKGAIIHLSAFNSPSSDWMNDGSGNLNVAVTEVAELWAAILKHLKDAYDVTVESVVIWNEPQYPAGGNRLTFTQAQHIDTVQAMGERFATEGLSTEVYAGDESEIDDAKTLATAIMADGGASPYVAGLAYHPYDGNNFSNPDAWVSLLQSLRDLPAVANNNLELRMTEWALNGVSGEMNKALIQAQTVYHSHTHGDVSVVDLWYVGPFTWSGDGNMVNESYAGGAVTWRKAMYVMGQYGKIEPGSQRLDVTPVVSSGTATPAVSAYLHPTSKSLTIVAINRAGSAKTIDVRLQNLGTSGNLKVYRTSATENMASIGSVTISGAAFTYDLPSESVTAFTTIVSATPPAPSTSSGGGGGGGCFIANVVASPNFKSHIATH